MPIEVNRINKECPECKNSTIFDTGKDYFCGKCLNSFDKEDMKKITVAEKIAEIRADAVFIAANGFHCEKSASLENIKDVILDPVESLQTNVSTVEM